MTTMTTGHPDPPAWLATRETHTAVVMLIGDRAYKMKKPVSLGFLDFTTRGSPGGRLPSRGRAES
jgi:aminoglycoside phosphotransferase family enzyme